MADNIKFPVGTKVKDKHLKLEWVVLSVQTRNYGLTRHKKPRNLYYLGDDSGHSNATTSHWEDELVSNEPDKFEGLREWLTI